MVNCLVLSWKDAKTFDGTEYNTFLEAAVARGIIDDKSDAVNAFEEMIPFSTPAELRALFVLLTINGYATIEIFRNPDHHRRLQEVYLLQRYCTHARANQNLLKNLSYRFRIEDKTNSMYGIPEPVE